MLLSSLSADRLLRYITLFAMLSLSALLIFLLVGIANILDVNIIGSGSVLRTAVIFFYISNEGVSLMENAAHLGLPVPEKIKAVLEQLHDRAEDKEDK